MADDIRLINEAYWNSKRPDNLFWLNLFDTLEYKDGRKYTDFGHKSVSKSDVDKIKQRFIEAYNIFQNEWPYSKYYDNANWAEFVRVATHGNADEGEGGFLDDYIKNGIAVPAMYIVKTYINIYNDGEDDNNDFEDEQPEPVTPTNYQPQYA